jgi:hypothetical protein
MALRARLVERFGREGTRKMMKWPIFGTFVDQLNAAGVQTNSARGFWGGVTPEGQVVATAWINSLMGECRFPIYRPERNQGGYREAWDSGRVHVGALIRLIVVRSMPGQWEKGLPKTVKNAALMPGLWRIVEKASFEEALVEPCEETRHLIVASKVA